MPPGVTSVQQPTNIAGPESALQSYLVEPNSINNIVRRKAKRLSTSDGTDLVSEIFGNPDPHVVDTSRYFPYFPDLMSKVPYALIAPKTLVGIEVEVENVMRIGPNVSTAVWMIKEDGSLRNNGREFVTPGVISLNVAEPSLRLLFSELNNDIDFSKRTSIHVHLDVRQLQFKQLVGMLFAYTVVENLLFKFVGNGRRNNIFCVPITETGVMEQMSADPNGFMQRIEQYWHKYTSLNLLPIAKLGSVEFRHMPGTKNVTKLMQWLDLISCLKVFSYKHPMEQIMDDIIRLNSNSRYQHFVESIFQDRCVYLDMSNLLNDMEKAVYLVKHCGMVNTFHQYVKDGPSNPDSQLGKRLMAWMRKLSPEQQEAIGHIHRLTAPQTGYDIEETFKQVIQHPDGWARDVPELRKWVQILIKDKTVETTKIPLTKGTTVPKYFPLDLPAEEFTIDYTEQTP